MDNRTTTVILGFTTDRPAGRVVHVLAQSGNVRPWVAQAYLDGRYLGHTGNCRTQAAAVRAAERLFVEGN